jgi:hypothetical protein
MRAIVIHAHSHGTCTHDPLPADFSDSSSTADAAFAW